MSAPFINDGTLAFGSRVLSITPPVSGSAVSYIADDINVTDPSKVVRAYGEKSAPRGAVGQRDFITGSATLQLATSSTAMPKKGGTFTENFFGDDVTFWITEVGRAENAGDLTKVPVQFMERINA
jgi:hypothetical protein